MPSAPSSSTALSRRPRIRAWAFPIVIILGVLVLTTLQISGSSIGALAQTPTDDPSLVFGQPRGIRSDEWLLTSPAAIGNDRRGLPATAWVGLTRTFLPASGLGVPSRHWSEVFRPSDWGFFVLPTGVAFAWRWWVPLLAGLIGVYALLLQLTRRPLISATMATVLTLSPYSAWWSSSPAMIIGYLGAAAACSVYGMARPRLLAGIAWGVLAGAFATMAGLSMYPPWLISVGLVVLAVIVGVALDRRVGWLRFGAVTASALLVLVPAMVQWTREALPSLTALAGTIYPGSRLSPSGGASARWLLDTPASLWWSGYPGSDLPLNISGRELAANGLQLFTNVSEASSTWLPLPLVAVAVLAALLSPRLLVRPATAGDPVRHRLRWTPALVTGVTLLLLGWALLPLPAWVGTITLLNRVPGYRTPLALGLAAVLLLANAAAVMGRARPRLWFVLLAVLGGGATAAGMTWAVTTLQWSTEPPPLPGIIVLAVLAGVSFTLLLLGRRLSAAGAVFTGLLATAVFVPVNPAYRGLGPMDDDPVVTMLRPFVTAGHPPKAAVYGGNARLNALVISTGMQSLTGLTVYPDRDFWERADPHQEELWNNFTKYAWAADPNVDAPVIEPVIGTQRVLRVDPCSMTIRELGIEYSVSSTPLASIGCLSLIRSVPRGTHTVYLYRYTS